MRIEDFFIGRLQGWVAITTPSGRVTRRVVLGMQGAWLERERALRLQETFSYGDGQDQHRAWTVHVDHEGLVRGQEAEGQGRLTGRDGGDVVRLHYAGPRGPRRRRLSPPMTLDFIATGEDGVVMAGRVGWGPLVLARVHGALRRIE